MECKLLGGVAIAGPDRTGIARKTATGYAAGLSFRRAQMRPAAWNIEAGCRYRPNGTGGKTRFLHT